MRCRWLQTQRLSAVFLSAAFLATSSLAAAAHVKWFAAYDVAGNPRSLLEVCSAP
ncbi:MAG: hypothetical protein JWL84_304, partial [Rhodospirillales bacterium]|nr:hypothetical protein [Rhodospirillales bacterium]